MTTRTLVSFVSVRTHLERKLAALPGLTRRPSRYGDSHSYFVADREIAHFHGAERMDVRLTKERIPELRSVGVLDSRVKTRGRFAEWVSLSLTDPRDVDYALQLVEEAVRANS